MHLIIILFGVAVFALIIFAALNLNEWARCPRCGMWHNLDTLETSWTLPLVTRGEILDMDCRTCAIDRERATQSRQTTMDEQLQSMGYEGADLARIKNNMHSEMRSLCQ